MEKVIHLKTARVYALNRDSTPKIERTTVKLMDGTNFNKFIDNIHLKGFMENEPPYVDKVLQMVDKKYVEIDKAPWQKIVDEAISKKGIKASVNYKELAEKQSKEINQLRANNDGFEERLRQLEGGGKSGSDTVYRDALISKANELKIKFRGNIGDAKLLAKIVEVEPDFKVENDGQ